ncbi:unnamed protein product, partial [Ixodes persulcatus]
VVSRDNTDKVTLDASRFLNAKIQNPVNSGTRTRICGPGRTDGQHWQVACDVKSDEHRGHRKAE